MGGAVWRKRNGGHSGYTTLKLRTRVPRLVQVPKWAKEGKMLRLPLYGVA